MKLFSSASLLSFLKIFIITLCLPLIVACGSDGDPLPDEITYRWEKVAVKSAFSAISEHQALVFKDQMWRIAGYASRPTQYVWSSNDGINWESSAFDHDKRFSERSQHQSVVFNNKIWVIGGLDINDKHIGDVWSSTNGNTWTKVKPTDQRFTFPARARHQVVVFDGHMWVIGGVSSDDEAKNDVLRSVNGENWITVKANDSAGFTARFEHQAVVFDNKMWVIGGRSSADGIKNDVWSSEDGSKWTEVKANDSSGFSMRQQHQAVVFDNKIWVIGGNNTENHDYTNDVWNSADGKTWMPVGKLTSSERFSERGEHQAVVFKDKIWVIGGFCYPSDSDDDICKGAKNDVWHIVRE
jgi:dihydrofolate reductase